MAGCGLITVQLFNDKNIFELIILDNIFYGAVAVSMVAVVAVPGLRHTLHPRLRWETSGGSKVRQTPLSGHGPNV
jgi:hypothetical protein